MKKIALIFIAISVLFSCEDGDNPDTNTELIGNWELIEVLADPGDGSGTFLPVTSEKTITFNEDGTIVSNGQLCNISISVGTPSSGTYSILDSTFSSPSCYNSDIKNDFEQNGNILIIQFFCIEPCMVKYKKSKN